MCPLGAQIPAEDPSLRPAPQPQVHMTDHLIECGLYLFKYLRSLQVRQAGSRAEPACALSAQLAAFRPLRCRY